MEEPEPEPAYTRTRTTPVPENPSPSSPVLPVTSSQSSSRPKKRPTVTPRTFTRFFTPRSSLERGTKIGASRQALRDITASASNRNSDQQRRTAIEESLQIFDGGDGRLESISKKRKRHKQESSATETACWSSPLKRKKIQSFEDSEDDNTDEEYSGSDQDPLAWASNEQAEPLFRERSSTRPTLFRRRQSLLGLTLNREIGGTSKTRGFPYGLDRYRKCCCQWVFSSETEMNRLRKRDVEILQWSR